MAPPKSGVKPCINDACRYPTRTGRARINEFPGTRIRMRGLCSTCAEVERPRKRESKREYAARLRAQQEIANNPPDPAVVASLGRFVQARNERLARLERMHR